MIYRLMLQGAPPMNPIPNPASMPVWAWVLIMLALFVLVPLSTAYIVNVLKARTEGQTAVAQSEIEANKNAKDKKLEELNAALKKALEDFAELEAAFKEERANHVITKQQKEQENLESERRNMHLANRLTIVKVSFRMVLSSYTAYFKEDPEQLQILQDFNTILKDDDAHETNEGTA